MSSRLRGWVVQALPATALRRLQRLRNGESPRLGVPAGRGLFPGPQPEVVQRFDAHEVRAATTAAICRALDLAAVPYVLLPGPRGRVEQIAVDRNQRKAVLAAIAPSRLGTGWRHMPRRPAAHGTSVLNVFRVIGAGNGRRLAGADLGCPIVFWQRVAPAKEQRRSAGYAQPGAMLAPQRNAVVNRLSADSWQRAVSSPTHWVEEEAKPPIFEVREPVDIVYAWVDGDDPTWQARKAEYEPHAAEHHNSATHPSRYAAREYLRYSLRSVAMYAGWVRRVHIVTDGQVPPWLNTSHPKIHLVDHAEIFHDARVLPVFNSHAIESQLHHVPGLADHYLYLNDDLFFGDPVEPELFFTGNRMSRFFLSDQTIDLEPPTVRDLPPAAAAKQNRTLIAERFGVTVRQKYRHGVHPQLRDVLVELEKHHPDEFARVARSRFRHPDDLAISSSLHHSYAYLRGRAVPSTMELRYQDIGRPDTARRLDEILRQRPQVFCLNEIAIEPQQFRKVEGVLRSFLEEYFPLPSPYECR